GVAPPPHIRRVADGVVRIRFGAAGAIDGQTVDGYLVGRRRAVVVDPGDPSGAAVEAVTRAADRAGARVAGSLLASAAPGHAAGAESLAIRLSVPILAAAGARSMLSSEVQAIADGDVIRIADVPIGVHAVPGRDPDGLAFSAPSLGVVIVGNLFGPGPSRSIPEPVDGDARRRSRALIRSMGLRRLVAHAPSPGGRRA